MPRKCPMIGCGYTIGERMFVCSRHWNRLPNACRDVVQTAFQRYYCEEISAAQLREVTANVLAYVQGVDVSEVEERPLAAAVGRCACGKTILFAQDHAASTGMIPLLECAADDRVFQYVVIGGEAHAALGRADIYTRFVRHWCPPHEAKKKPRGGSGQPVLKRPDSAKDCQPCRY